MSESDEVELNIKGNGIDPRAVGEAILAVDKLMRSVSSEDGPLTITHLSTGSANARVQASEAAIRVVDNGLLELSQSAMIPSGWNRTSIEAVIELGAARKRAGVTGLSLRALGAIQSIDEQILLNATSSLNPATVGLGSVSGLLYRYNNDPRRGTKRSASLRTAHGPAVKITFQPSLVEAVRAAIDQVVEVWGTVFRDSEDRIIGVEAERVEVLRVETVSAKRTRSAVIRGVLGSDWTDGKDSVDWVREQRD
ncbi:hypothetical protein [Gordonia amicalis]|uniref:hypothetical protein n=1 Tax=Gordonia amicalis TaxID=89053 RepID=UPI003A81212C